MATGCKGAFLLPAGCGKPSRTPPRAEGLGSLGQTNNAKEKGVAGICSPGICNPAYQERRRRWMMFGIVGALLY